MPNHRVGDTTHQSSPQTTAPSAAHDDEASSNLLGYPHDIVGGMVLEAWVVFGQPQVHLRNLPSALLDLLYLLIEYLLGLAPKFFGHFRDANVVRGGAWTHGEDVQL